MFLLLVNIIQQKLDFVNREIKKIYVYFDFIYFLG